MPDAREQLFERGLRRAERFCQVNQLVVPEVVRKDRDDWPFDSTCAYYRPTYIAICVERCAQKGYAARAWSWPGYVIDRTPYGVIAHELGHHVDITRSGLTTGYQGTYSRDLRKRSGEPPITSYAPNDAEWFAEICRLFITNPDLLGYCRPKTYELLWKDGLRPTSMEPWNIVLAGAPERTIEMAKRKMVTTRGLAFK